jgi:hypothetical protein
LIVILFKLSEAEPLRVFDPHPMSSTALSLYSSLFVLGSLVLQQKTFNY